MKNDELVILKKPPRKSVKSTRKNSENFLLNFKKKKGTTHRDYTPQKLIVNLNENYNIDENDI